MPYRYAFYARFIDQFLEENPLVCCSDEISSIRALMDTEAGDKLKLSQKTSSVSVHIIRGKYYFKAKIIVPNDYPEKQVRYSSSPRGANPAKIREHKKR